MRAQLYYTIEVRNREGRVVSRESRRSRSYVKQFLQMLWNCMAYEDLASVVETDGTSRTLTAASTSYHLRAKGAAASSILGIVVGTDDTAVTISDYQLGSQIADGAGAGQLNHQAQTFAAPAVSGTECSFTTTRVFQNGSGNSITVKEIGMYFLHNDETGGGYFMGIRDVLASSQVVPDGGAITVVYTLKVTV